MKRIGGLKQQLGAGVTDLTVDERSPKEQLRGCYAEIRNIESRQRGIFRILRNALGDSDKLVDSAVHLLSYEELSSEEKDAVREEYLRNVFPLVTPQP